MLDALRSKHDFEAEDRDRYEPGDGLRTVGVCRSCGHEQEARSRGEGPTCPDETSSPRWIETAKRSGLLPQTEGARTDSVAGVPGTSPRCRSPSSVRTVERQGR
jgi:hypothetical protein